MRTLFVGAGATGGYFGGRLAQAGKDVTFLVRPGRQATLARRGLRIKGPDGEAVVHPHTVTAESLGGPYDLVVLAVKSYALEQAMLDLAPALGPRTVIVPLLNGIRHIDQLVGAFGPERVWGGVCVIMATLDADDDVVLMGGPLRLGYGPLDGADDDRLPEVTFALEGEEFDSHPSHTIVGDMWEKWVLLATLGAITTLMQGTVGDINRAPGGATFAQAVMAEAIAVATAAGHAPRPGAVALFEHMVAGNEPTTSSMYRDMVAGRPVEADAILGDFVTRAAEHDVPVPLLSAAYTRLTLYSAGRTTPGRGTLGR
ncbi:MAG TPA: ketopantoate reductase family protein [Actinoplanes sp.]